MYIDKGSTFDYSEPTLQVEPIKIYRKGIIMRNSNFNLIKSLGYIVVLVSMASHSVPHEYWQNTEDGLLYGHVGDSEEEYKLLMMEGAV